MDGQFQNNGDADASLRQALKDRTSDSHARVDRLLSSFDIRTPVGLRQFLEVHHSCFVRMRAAAQPQGLARLGLHEMAQRIETDLAFLGTQPPAPSAEGIGAIHPMALDYVVEGSRLGSAVLKRRWATSPDPTVQQACAYFSMEPVKGRWRAVCLALSRIKADSALATRIVADANTLFELFHTAACARQAVTDARTR